MQMIDCAESPQESTKFLELLLAKQLSRHLTKKDKPMENKQRKDTQCDYPLWNVSENHNELLPHSCHNGHYKEN